MAKKRNWKRIIPVIVTIAVFLILAATQATTAYAAPQHGFGRDPGRIDSINENDFHTSQWERFSFNYQFVSGADHRFELGRPTTFNGFVPADVFTVNVRRDANVTMRPPSYGIFSGFIPTDPASRFFPQPINPNFHQPFMIESTALDPRFDTLQQGVNAQPIGNPMNVQQNTTTGGFLPPTSIQN
jgi:hypothetical protein